MPAAQQPAPSAAPSTAAPAGPQLTLAQAERMALQHNPNISVARLLQLAQAQVTREVRSVEFPIASGDLTAVDAHKNSRITAGLLNNPTVYNRAAGGLTVSQLITDFGRTHRLVLSAKANASAQFETERATEQDITLAADQAFFQGLTAQAVLKVAKETVSARQTTVDQISALTKAKLRSTLDLSFADVELSKAKLLLLDAQNASDSAMANLNAVLGSDQNTHYVLVDETPTNPQVAPDNAEAMVQQAFQSRPDLIALQDRFNSAQQYSKAEHDLWRPTVSALAAFGGAPVRSDQIFSSWYGAAGANVNIPIFNGFLYNARAHEADLRASAAGEQVRNMRDYIARDTRTAVLNAQTAFQRIGVTQEMLNESNLALDLAATRYKYGLDTIVELTQAQLGETEAQIAYYNARYSYQTALAVVRYEIGQ